MRKIGSEKENNCKLFIMNKVQSYRDLIIWQKSIALVTMLYKATMQLPKEEMYGLTSQMRRSAVSIPSNIAEGFGRNSQLEFKRFLNIALGSLFELETQVEICKNLEYFDINISENLLEKTLELEKMLNSFITKMKVK